MNTIFRRALLCLTCCALAVPAASYPTASHASEIVLGGTGGALATMRILGDAYVKVHHKDSIKVLPSLGSRGGIKAVTAGAIDLGLSSRPPKPKERNRGARAIPYADSALVFVTTLRTKIKSITTAQILNIYAGTTRQWQDGGAIRLILRPKSDGDTQYLLKYFPGFAAAYEKALNIPGVPVAYTDQEAVAKIKSTVGGFGVSSLSLIRAEKHNLKVLSINGTAPSSENIADRSYPYVKTFYFVVANQPKPAIKEFLAFVFSAEGAAILRRLGHHPRQQTPFK